jgi:hypothetical protein
MIGSILKAFVNSSKIKKQMGHLSAPHISIPGEKLHCLTGLNCGTDRGINSTAPYKIPVSFSSINIHTWQ